MITIGKKKYVVSAEFDKDYAICGIHSLKTVGTTYTQVSIMIFGLIFTFGKFI